MILYGPKFFSDSFLEGLVDLKYFALMNTWSLTLKFGVGFIWHQQVLGITLACAPFLLGGIGGGSQGQWNIDLVQR